MPYFTLEHVRIALDYLAESSHPSLVSFLAMTRHNLPVQGPGIEGAEFGSKQENAVLRPYFSLDQGTPDWPFYVPFGKGRKGATYWRPRTQGGSSAQRMRSSKPFVFYREGKGTATRWWFAANYLNALKTQQGEVIGARPISIHHLAVWFYRQRDVIDHADAIKLFRQEFNLDAYSLVPDVFTEQQNPELAGIALLNTPIGSALGSLIPPLSAGQISLKVASTADDDAEDDDSDGELSAAEDASVSPGSWDITETSLEAHTGHLKGMAEAISQAVAALRSGMHVVFTGPPGSGKTDLAQRLCEAGGFRPWQVTATDQWGTFETIGGYFPDPDAGGHILDFKAGTVVEAIEQDKILIIDEVNRADIDKAFGELFTLLSGHPVDLMFQRKVGAERRRIRLAFGTPAPEDGIDVISVPKKWRIIAAMNDADKASLKRLSYAFVRRFAFIPIPVPQPDEYRALVNAAAFANGLATAQPEFVEALNRLFADKAGLASIDMAMGYAIPKAILRHAVAENAVGGRSGDDILRSTLELYVAPQFQGRADRHIQLLELLRSLLTPSALVRFDQTLATWTGYRKR